MDLRLQTLAFGNAALQMDANCHGLFRQASAAKQHLVLVLLDSAGHSAKSAFLTHGVRKQEVRGCCVGAMHQLEAYLCPYRLFVGTCSTILQAGYSLE